jgi:hypothetical protein
VWIVTNHGSRCDTVIVSTKENHGHFHTIDPSEE